jgi:hypothetical protein
MMITMRVIRAGVARSVAVIGGVFHALCGVHPDARQRVHASIVALRVIATSQRRGAGFGMRSPGGPRPIRRRALI